MKKDNAMVGRGLRAQVCGLAFSLLAACAAAPPPAVAPVEPERVRSFDEAATRLGANMLSRALELPAPAGGKPRTVAIDPLIESANGQQTAATEALHQRIAGLFANQAAAVSLKPLHESDAADSGYLLLGTISNGPASAPESLRLDLALIDLRLAKVLFHASELAAAQGVDRTPLPYFRDSPVRVKDPAVDAYVRTASTDAGLPVDPAYLQHANAAPVIEEAASLYNTGRYDEALGRYRAASQLPSGKQLRVYTGIYLSLLKLGRGSEAELAFGAVVAAGMRYNELSLKLLFAPGRTDFWADPRVSGPYAMWLRQVARQADAAKTCLLISGHTSATGKSELNESLSLQRANVIKQRLVRESGDLASRIKTVGVGSAQNIVGSGTDDAADALDRRVEFKVTACEAKAV
ncbi:hypothetical protein BH11PSE8_BH11PSE8_33220 [soil metagenome]